jgi:Pentapeptide repeats (8 copies)
VSGTIIGITLVVAVVVGLIGALLAFGPARRTQRDLGVGLLSGATVGLAIFALQLVNETNANEIQDKQEEAARRETVQLAIATTGDLSGFDPRDEPLTGMYLAGKKLRNAQFEGADLTRAELRDSRMQGALLGHATLRKANLIGADLREADLEDADLSGAWLHAANFFHAEVEHIKSLKGAIANADTCWPEGFLEAPQTKRLVSQLKAATGSAGVPSKGHTCTKEESLGRQ